MMVIDPDPETLPLRTMNRCIAAGDWVLLFTSIQYPRHLNRRGWSKVGIYSTFLSSSTPGVAVLPVFARGPRMLTLQWRVADLDAMRKVGERRQVMSCWLCEECGNVSEVWQIVDRCHTPRTARSIRM